MKIKSFIALLLVLCIVLGTAGCVHFSRDLLDQVTDDGQKGGKDKNTPTYSDDKKEPSDAAYFDSDVWRDDVDYSDMEYVHYDINWLAEYTDPIYDMAENGATPEEFEDADFNLYDELYYIFTLYTLMSNQTYADATDEYAAQESLYAQDVYYKANNEYWSAMHALAVSPHADLLEDYYDDYYIHLFEVYEPVTDEQVELNSRESQLIQEYYAMMSVDDPDYYAIAELYVDLVNLRNQDAALSGYSSYAEYAYDSFYAKDYTPEEAEVVWQGAKDYFVPILNKYAPDILDRTRELYNSDLDCSVDSVLEALGAGLDRISPEMRDAYDFMIEHGLYDIAPSSTKSEVGFTTLLYWYNEPFIFNAATDTFLDYTDMFHEFGHFNNYFYTESSLIFGMPDNDLTELQSQGLEVLFTFLYDDLFDEETADTMRDYVLLDMIYSVVDGALYDEFQQRVYSEPDLTPERVCEIYSELFDEYGYSRYDGYEYEWAAVSHNFEAPFYYISYAVSALGALEINDLCRDSWASGVDKYLTVAAMDPESYYYSEALSEAGFSDIFEISSYVSIADALDASLNA